MESRVVRQQGWGIFLFVGLLLYLLFMSTTATAAGQNTVPDEPVGNSTDDLTVNPAESRIESPTGKRAEDPGQRVGAPLVLTINSGVQVPVETGYDLMNPGVGVDVQAYVRLPVVPWLGIGTGITYAFIPVRAETSISFVSAVGAHGGVWSGTEEMPDSVWTVTPASRWTPGCTWSIGAFEGD